METVETREEIVIRKITNRTCDDCGKNLHSLRCNQAKCRICGADLCGDCIAHEEELSAEYKWYYCRSCWELEDYHDRIEKLNQERDRLLDEWISKGKLARQKILEHLGACEP